MVIQWSTPCYTMVYTIDMFIEFVDETNMPSVVKFKILKSHLEC